MSITLEGMADAPYKLILLRHGESEWNAKNLFTGWVDVNLNEKGEKEAVRGGELLKDAGLLPDVVHTSVQKRAIRTAQLALEAADRHWIPVHRSWRLNERHYGALQGKDKAQTLAEFGEEQFMLWRRSYDTPPPPLADDAEFSQIDDPRYAIIPSELRPRTECLKDVVVRMLPYWYDSIVPDLAAGRTVLVAAHGNSLRAWSSTSTESPTPTSPASTSPPASRSPTSSTPTSTRSTRAAPTSTRRPPRPPSRP